MLIAAAARGSYRLPWQRGSRRDRDARNVRPQLAYKWTSFAIKAELVLIGGDPNSFGDFLSRNNTAYVIARHSL